MRYIINKASGAVERVERLPNGLYPPLFIGWEILVDGTYSKEYQEAMLSYLANNDMIECNSKIKSILYQGFIKSLTQCTKPEQAIFVKCGFTNFYIKPKKKETKKPKAFYHLVSREEFVKAAIDAHAKRDIIDIDCILRNATVSTISYYLHEDGQSGFGMAFDKKELVSVFSSVKGRGKSIVKTGTKLGARRLNCYAIPELIGLYISCGYVPYKAEKNWNEKGYDVVFMAYKQTGAKL